MPKGLEKQKESAKDELLRELAELREKMAALEETHSSSTKELMELRHVVDAYQSIGQAYLNIDRKGMILDANNPFLSISGHARGEVVGKNIFEFNSPENEENLPKLIASSLAKEGQWKGEIFAVRKNGDSFPVWLNIRPDKKRGGKALTYSAIVLDITSIKENQKRLEQMAHYDVLTNLPNRTLMYDRLNHTVSLAKRHEYQIAVLLLDLDRFKEVNDSLGHHIGDLLLVETAGRLMETVRESDTVARMGGDEFLIILPEVGSTNNAANIAHKIIEYLAKPFFLEEHEIYVSGSIGITIFPIDGDDPDLLIKHSDTAMYHAKAQGKNNYKFFTEDINKSTVERFSLETRFRRALDKLEFHLHYQPKIDIRTRKIVGMEALLRWYHADHGSIMPSLFIPLAEETGLVIQLGEWALREACRQNREWQDMGLRPMRVSVNISPLQFKKRDLLEIISEVLEDTGLSPQYLMIEITEGTIIDNVEDTIHMLKALRKMGVGVSVDDFGTGYSSLNYLNRFALDELKIDRSFITDIENKENQKVVNAIISLANNLNYKIVAEGVETKEQLKFFENSNCDEIQGYYFSLPLNAEDFHALLAEDKTFSD